MGIIKTKDALYLFEKVKENGSRVVLSPEELATYFRKGQISGNLMEFIQNSIELYGYAVCTHFSSIDAKNTWYFNPELFKYETIS